MLEEHPAALTYDWRSRFGLPVTAPWTGQQTYAEAYLLLVALLADPTSRTSAAVRGWDHPWSREAFVLADLYDLTRDAHTDPKRRGRVRPYPRPNARADSRARGQRSAPPAVDQAAIRVALTARGWR